MFKQKHTLYTYTIVFFGPECSGAKNITSFKYNKQYKEKKIFSHIYIYRNVKRVNEF